MNTRVNLTPALEEWRGRNPYLLWLNRGDPAKRPERFRKLIERGGVTVRASVYAWFNGRALPKPAAMLALRTLTKVGIDAYMEWWESRPTEEGSWPVQAEHAGDSSSLTPSGS